MAGGLQALAHHAIQDQRHEADAGMGLDALGQPVEHRRNLDLRLEHLKVRIPLMADSDSIPIADSVPDDGGHAALVSRVTGKS